MTRIKYATQCIKNKGSMAWEYNPLYNFRKGNQYLKDSEGNYLSADRNILTNVVTWDNGAINNVLEAGLIEAASSSITKQVTTISKVTYSVQPSRSFKTLLENLGFSSITSISFDSQQKTIGPLVSTSKVSSVEADSNSETTNVKYYVNNTTWSDDETEIDLKNIPVSSCFSNCGSVQELCRQLAMSLSGSKDELPTKDSSGKTIDYTDNKVFINATGLMSNVSSLDIKLVSVLKTEYKNVDTKYIVSNYKYTTPAGDATDDFSDSTVLTNTSISDEYKYGVGILDLYASENKIVTEVSGESAYHFTRNGKYYKCLDNTHRVYDSDGNITGLKHVTSDIYPLVYEEDGIIEDLITGGNGETDVLDFDLRHPVEIECQQSYDGSTNLILNDNKNIPRLINTRFTPLELNTYERIDRKGNTDTNLYDNDEFDLDTSLNKRYKHIPVITFNGLTYGGQLKVGMYTFYFKLADADGNETDVVAETGCIPVYIGNINTPQTIRGGQLDENSYKGINLTVSNIDTAYDYLSVYYSRSSNVTGVEGNVTYHKILDKYRILSQSCSFIITGTETTEVAAKDEILSEHQIFSKVKTQAQCQNMLFLGNATKPKVDYDELQKLSLEFLPFYQVLSCDTLIGYPQYDGEDAYGIGGYYNASSVYNYVGYWPEEMYRFGIVYIMDDGSLTPVFNIRGIGELTNIQDIMVTTNTPSPFYATEWDKQPDTVKKSDKTGKIAICSNNNPYTERDTFTIDYDTNWINKLTLENSAGVVRFPSDQIAVKSKSTEEQWDYESSSTNVNKASGEYREQSVEQFEFGNPVIYGLAIKVGDDVIKELREKHHIKGHFIVRQKRIPTILAQAFTEGFDDVSGTPIIRINHANDYTSQPALYCTETFLKTDASLPVNDDEDIDDSDVNPQLISWPTKTKKSYTSTEFTEKLLDEPSTETLTAFCPEFELNQSYYNSIFSGGKFPVKNVTDPLRMVCDENNDRFMFCSWNNCWKKPTKDILEQLHIISIPDNTPLIRNDGHNFRARCGEAEDISFISCVPKERYKIPTKDNYVSFKKKKSKFKKWLKIVAIAVTVAAAVAVTVCTWGAAAPISIGGAVAAIGSITTIGGVATAVGTAVGATALTLGVAVAAGAATAGIMQGVASGAKAIFGDNAPKGYTPLNSAIIRGSFGSYLGMSGNKNLLPSEIVNIYVPGNESTSDFTKFKIRFNDQAPYYAVTDRVEYHDYTNRCSSLSYTDSRGNTRTMNDSVIAVFRGDCYISNFTHRLNRNFNDPDAQYNDIIVDKNTWKNNWKGASDHADVNRGDINAVKLGLWVTFPIRSSMNLCYRDTDSTYSTEYAACGIPRGFYPFQEISVAGNHKIPESQCYNQGFSSSTGQKTYFTNANVPYLKNNFQTRIAYSIQASTDAFRNGFREFQSTAYKDYPLQYGGLMRLVEFGNSLIAVFEHGVGKISVNQQALFNSSNEKDLQLKLGVANVLSEIQMYSTDFGTQWPESVCVTNNAVYGVDTVGKKIWQISSSGFKLISDFKVQKFLNENITLEERETEVIIGVRNVKTHYNAYKGDVMFTYYDNTIGFEEKAWNLCYNEQLGKFTTFYSWIPSWSENIHNIYFSYDRNASKWIANLGMSIADTTTQPKISNTTAQSFSYFDNFDEFDTDARGTCVESVLIDKWESCTVTENDKVIECYRTPLYLQNKYFPTGKDVWVKYKFSVQRDNFGNFKYFFTNSNVEESDYTDGVGHKEGYFDYGASYLYIAKDNVNKLRFKMLKEEPQKPVIQLCIKCEMSAVDINATSIGSYDVKRSEKYVSYNAGYFETQLCLTFSEVTSLKEVEFATGTLLFARKNGLAVASLGNGVYIDYNLASNKKIEKFFPAVYPKLRTDFWKHGQAGLIDDVEKIKPCLWYGKQHPFEINFIVGAEDGTLKHFQNLMVFSNNVKPESVHMTINGDLYDFSKDKRNMYLRQEATKAFYQQNGSDILYDHTPFQDSDFMTNVKPILASDFLEKADNDNYLRNKVAQSDYYKATMLPLIYSRQDTFNEIEDFYKKAVNHSKNVDYQNYSGGEIVFNEQEDSFKICNHQLIRDIEEVGRARGNAQFTNGYWAIQIQPLNIYQKNEQADSWYNKDSSHIVPPISVGNAPVPEDFNPLNITVGNNDGKIFLSDKAIDYSLIRDGKNEDVINANKRGDNTSLQRFVPSDVYAFYKDTSQLDLSSWNTYYNGKRNVPLLDNYMDVKLRWAGDKLVLLKAIQTTFDV